MKEFTEMDTEYGKFFVCNGCGAQGDDKDNIKHHSECDYLGSLYWQLFYSFDEMHDIGINELKEKVEQAASSTYDWVQDAVGDMAFDYNFLDEEWREKVKKAKKNGVIDIRGWLADEFYNDVDTLQDLMGDHIYDRSTEICGAVDQMVKRTAMILICKEMMGVAHSAMKTALSNIITDNDVFIKKLAKKNREKVKQCVKTLIKPIT